MDTEQLLQLNVAQLYTFRHVMNEGGYAAAAKVTQLSVPSVWQHVRALERICGVSLFERAGRRVLPTDAAERLLLQVDELLVHLESTFSSVSGSETRKPIRLAVNVRTMLEDLATPLAAFRRRRSTPLVIRQADDRRAEELLLADEADVALALEPGLHHDSDRIHYSPAYKVEFFALSKRNHPFAKSSSGGLRELAKHELIVTAAGTHGRDALDQAFHREGLSVNIAVETDNSAYTIACVTAGMGVGILAGRRDGRLCRNLAARSLRTSFGRRNIVFMWRKGRVLSESTIELIEEIRKSAKRRRRVSSPK